METNLDSYVEGHCALLAILWQKIFQPAASNMLQQHLIGVRIMRQYVSRVPTSFNSEMLCAKVSSHAGQKNCPDGATVCGGIRQRKCMQRSQQPQMTILSQASAVLQMSHGIQSNSTGVLASQGQTAAATKGLVSSSGLSLVRQSATTFSEPFLQCTVKSNSCSLGAQRSSLASLYRASAGHSKAS